MIDTTPPAFPFDHGGPRGPSRGMTMRQYAAIHLRIPNSGTDWLDAMITEAAREEIVDAEMPDTQELEKAMLIISRQAPCPHEHVDTSLGNGKTWCLCEDCGATISQERLPQAKQAAEEFTEAIASILRAIQKMAGK